MRAALRLGLLGAVLMPAAAGGQVQLSAVLGYRAGASSFPVEADVPSIQCLLPPCVVAEARTPEGPAVGLVLDVPIAERWAVELLLNRQDADLELSTDLSPEAGRPMPESFELTILQAGVLRHWQKGHWTPFVAAGLGFGRVATSARILVRPVGVGETGVRPAPEEALSLGLGGGARQALHGRWSLRYEARAYWIDLPAELGGGLAQLEVGVGLAVDLWDR